MTKREIELVLEMSAAILKVVKSKCGCCPHHNKAIETKCENVLNGSCFYRHLRLLLEWAQEELEGTGYVLDLGETYTSNRV